MMIVTLSEKRLWGGILGMKMVGNNRENPLTVTIPVFLVGNGRGNGKCGRENEFGITGYRERNISIGNMSITIRKISITGNTTHVTTLNS